MSFSSCARPAVAGYAGSMPRPACMEDDATGFPTWSTAKVIDQVSDAGTPRNCYRYVHQNCQFDVKMLGSAAVGRWPG